MHQFCRSLFRVQSRIPISLQGIISIGGNQNGKRVCLVRCQSSGSGGGPETKPETRTDPQVSGGMENEKIETSIPITGDTLTLLLFAAIGKANYGEPVSLETIGTALPFIMGWCLSSAFVNGYGPGTKSGEVVRASARAGKCWIIGVPDGIGIRSAYLGYQPPAIFVGISMAAIGVLMVRWRFLYAYTMADKATSSNAKPGGGNKKGNPFDFLKLLFNLKQQ